MELSSRRSRSKLLVERVISVLGASRLELAMSSSDHWTIGRDSPRVSWSAFSDPGCWARGNKSVTAWDTVYIQNTPLHCCRTPPLHDSSLSHATPPYYSSPTFPPCCRAAVPVDAEDFSVEILPEYHGFGA